MSWFVLMWHGHGLVSVELDDGRELILVFDDSELALRCGEAIAAAEGLRYTQVVSLEGPRSTVRERLATLAMEGALDKMVILFPGDALHDTLVSQILGA